MIKISKKNEKGITMVVLIVMIVVLLILAGISINAIVGNNGIIKKSSEEAIAAKRSEIIENVQGIYLGEKTKALMYSDSSNVSLDDEVDNEKLGKKVADKINSKYGTSAATYNSDKKQITVRTNSDPFFITDNGITNEDGTDVVIAIKAATVKQAANYYYGKTVTNYNCNARDVKEWQILFSDGNNIYLVASDFYLNRYSEPTKDLGYISNRVYQFAFKDEISTSDQYGLDKIKNGNIKRWIKYNGAGINDRNAKCASYMLDADVWKAYKGDNADYAIGGPTLDMLAESYYNRNNKIVQFKDNRYGYSMKFEGDANYDVTLDINLDYIFDHVSTDRAEKMWVASPNAYDTNNNHGRYLVQATSSKIGYAYDTTNKDGAPGFRPVVCLDSNVILEANGENTYKIK